ncbi:nucleotidyltransferase domain-containing protein [Lactococcus allomyrinae]|uniref:Nucleotidyltransferase domain-containing protein n=2 Tax=Lactococcus allomyrinae TaxID=2419773 RepID=A0A387BK49_9LACT|nr:nucleotidyltransferase domain-containing protein [Lactococcus allomyrinae]
MNPSDEVVLMTETDWREQLIFELTEECSKINGILGMFLGGSLASGGADEFSDVDLRLLIEHGVSKSEFLSVLTKREDLLFIETLTEHYAVLHFEHFVKIDVFVYFLEELSPSVWLRKIKILMDTNDFLSVLTRRSMSEKFQLTQEEFDFYLGKFYAYVHEIFRRSQREEWNYAQECGIYLKNILCTFWYIALGEQPNSLGNWSKYEGKRSKLSLEQQNWLVKYTSVSNVQNFLTEVTERAFSVLTEIGERWKVDFDDEKFRKVVEKVDVKSFSNGT